MRRPLPLSLTALLLACGPTGPEDPPPLLTALPRALSPAEVEIVDGANAFSFDLLREATRTLPADQNAFLSPLSASMALGMALNGANGETYEEMRTALGLGALSEAAIDQGYRDLMGLLVGLDPRTEMLIANSMWAREGFALEPTFTDAGRNFFDAEIASLNFGDPGALDAINGWVSGKTRGRIPTLLEQIDSNEMLFLINAIYFKGKWRTAFDPGDTRTAPFYAADGRERAAPLMHQEETLAYGETDAYQAVDLLYGNGAFAMTVLLPKPGRTPAELLSELDPASWRALAEGFHDAEVSLTLPRFRLEYSRQLREDLESLGMVTAFDEARADFYRIADVRPERLYITRVEQKTFVEVNEQGTEAAAATSVGIGATSAPEIVVMQVDRPFAFAIRERLSGTVVFLGVMNVVGQ
jgi:serpin B